MDWLTCKIIRAMLASNKEFGGIKMRIDKFSAWLESSGMSPGAQADVKSRCKRVERDLHVDLDKEYAKGGGRSLLAILDYTAEDKRNMRPAPEGLMFEGDIKAGMSSLKSAVNTYFLFCSQN